MSTIERIRKLRTNRLGHHYDLLREAGACDASGNGRELTHDDLTDLDETALLLGRSERALTDDLAASLRYRVLQNQLFDAEAAIPEAKRKATSLEEQITAAVQRHKSAVDVANGNRLSNWSIRWFFSTIDSANTRRSCLILPKSGLPQPRRK